MKSLLAAFCMIFCLTLFPHHGFCADAKNTMDAVVSMTPLDENALKAAALKRLVNTIKQQNPAAVGLENITVNNLKIAQKEPIQFGNTHLWMVKLRFDALPMIQTGDAKTLDMTMTVDPTGTYQYSDVSTVETAENLFTNARREINKLEIPEQLGHLLMKGTGKAKVLFISDPFCSFCRAQYKYLKGETAKFAEVKLLHMPMANLHPSAPFTTAILSFAKDKLPQEQFVQVVDYAYTEIDEDIKPSSVNNNPVPATIEQEQVILKKFTDKFASLTKDQQGDALFYYIKGKYVALVNEEVKAITAKFQVQGTPNTFIDGYSVRGFQRAEIEYLLNKK